MPGNDSELAMMGLVLAIMLLVFAVVWFVFMLPMEKGLHKRRMELLQRKLVQNEQRLKREAGEKAKAESANREQNEDRPRRRASGS
jgi:choline-glycine betaine transporter